MQFSFTLHNKYFIMVFMRSAIETFTLRPCAGRVSARGLDLFSCGGAGCGPDQCGVGRAAGLDMANYAGWGMLHTFLPPGTPNNDFITSYV